LALSASGLIAGKNPVKIRPFLLRAAVITSIGPDRPGGCGPARMLYPDGVRHPLAKFAHVINVYLNFAFAVTSQAAEEIARTSARLEPGRSDHQHRVHRGH
jgi:hypothetical protein